MDSIKNSVYKGLRWLEYYTKTDMVYLARGGFWLGVGQFIASGSAFITSLAFANILDPEIFGIYKYIISINSILLITTLSGMDSAITQSVARGFDKTLEEGVKTKMKWGVFGTIMAFCISLYYLLNGNNPLAISFGIVGMFLPFTESFDMYNSLLLGKKLFDVQTRYNIIKKIISLVSIVTTIFITKNIYIILFVYFSSIVLPNIFFLEKTKKLYSTNDSVDNEAVSYGKQLSLSYIANMIASEIDKILVFQYVGASNLAIYSLATAPNDQIKGLFKNINSLAMPKFSEKNIEDIKKVIWHKIKILFLSMSVIILIYIFLAPIFFNTFFPKYLESIRYSQILSVSLIPVIISGFIYTILESQKAKKEIHEFNVYSNIFGIIFLIPMIYYFGVMGAVLSRLITRTFGFLLSVRLLKKLV